jgi:hypothetical protein
MIKKYLSGLTLFLVFVILVAPLAVSAVGGTLTEVPKNINVCVSCILNNIFTPLWQLAAGLAVVMFIVAGILFITANGEPGKITTAKNALIWAVVGIVVAVVAFSIVTIVGKWF